MFGTVQDVTERTRAEVEIRRARDELDLRVRERTAALTEALAALGRQEEARKELLRRVVTVQEVGKRRPDRHLVDAGPPFKRSRWHSATPAHPAQNRCEDFLRFHREV